MAIIRNTIAKKAVFEIIQVNKTAMSQTEIFAKANNICDRVTVYRILERLVKEVKIHKIVNINGVINYAPCNSCEHEQHVHHDHLHFSCTTCKKLTCISDNHIELNIPSNYQVAEVFLTVSGICPSCSKIL